MEIGKMRHKIKIIKDGVEFHKAYAAVTESYGKEKEAAMAAKTETFIKFEIRYYPKLKDLRQAKLFEVEFKGEKFKLRDVDFNNYKGDKMYLYTVNRT